MSEDEYDYDDCPNCGGEGVTFDCFDGCCADVDIGCDLCERRCDWCRPAPKKQAPPEFGEILADALRKSREL